MNEDVLNLSIRRFLKQFGVTAQRDIEHAVQAALAGGKLRSGTVLKATAVLRVEGLGELTTVDGDLSLE
jgi:hypothetical protein